MDATLGQIIPWGVDNVPFDFLPCDGRILQILQHQALFAVIGAKFGGNGTTTFALPDLRGRVVVGAGQQPGGTNFVPGAWGGSETVTLSSTQVPPHGHVVYANSNATAPASGTGTNNLLGTPANGIKMYNTSATNTKLNSSSVTTVGAGAGHENMQPYQVVNYIICVSGLFPPHWD